MDRSHGGRRTLLSGAECVVSTRRLVDTCVRCEEITECNPAMCLQSIAAFSPTGSPVCAVCARAHTYTYTFLGVFLWEKNHVNIFLNVPFSRNEPTHAFSTGEAVEDMHGFHDNRRRSVSFDNSIRVVLVPTRHELKMVGGGGDGKLDGEEGGGEEGEAGGGEGEGHDGDGGGRDCGGGIWWSLQECLEFRRSFRRQLVALGWTTRHSILSAALGKLLADAEDSDSDTDSTSERNTERETKNDQPRMPRDDEDDVGSCGAEAGGRSSTDHDTAPPSGEANTGDMSDDVAGRVSAETPVEASEAGRPIAVTA